MDKVSASEFLYLTQYNVSGILKPCALCGVVTNFSYAKGTSRYHEPTGSGVSVRYSCSACGGSFVVVYIYKGSEIVPVSIRKVK